MFYNSKKNRRLLCISAVHEVSEYKRGQFNSGKTLVQEAENWELWPTMDDKEEICASWTTLKQIVLVCQKSDWAAQNPVTSKE